MFPKPDDDLQSLLEELGAYGHQKPGFSLKDPLPGLLIKVRKLGKPAALPYLLALTHSPNAEVRKEAELAVSALLPLLPPEQILELEILIRESWLKFNSDGHDFRAAANAAWKLSTLAASGWRREKAVLELANIHDTSALLFILLRLNDWVVEVRKAAERWVLNCEGKIQAAQIVDCIPVLSALLERQQGRSSRFVQSLIGRLATEEVAPALLSRLSALDSRSRRLVFSLLSQSGALRAPEVQVQLLQQPNPILGVMLLKRLKEQASELPDRLLDYAIASKSAILRRAGLYSMTAPQIERFVPLLWKAILDPAQGVREFARYHLLKRASVEDLQARCLSELHGKCSSSRAVAVCILGFHECQGKWDVAQYEEWSSHPSVRVRTAVMRCYHISHPGEALPWVRRELSSAAESLLGKTALTILLKKPYSLSLTEVVGCLHESRPMAVRLRGFSILRRRGKWEQLPELLKLLHDKRDDLRHQVTLRLVVWLQGFNRSQVQPSRDQIDAVKAALSQCSKFMAQGLYRQFEALIGSL